MSHIGSPSRSNSDVDAGHATRQMQPLIAVQHAATDPSGSTVAAAASSGWPAPSSMHAALIADDIGTPPSQLSSTSHSADLHSHTQISFAHMLPSAYAPLEIEAAGLGRNNGDGGGRPSLRHTDAADHTGSNGSGQVVMHLNTIDGPIDSPTPSPLGSPISPAAASAAPLVGGAPKPASAARPGNNFDAIRLFAAISVLIVHSYALCNDSDTHDPYTFSFPSLGVWGVATFFTISGYLLSHSWRSDPHLGRYTIRRLLRLWPALAVCTVLMVFVFGPCVTELSVGEYFRSGHTWGYLFGNLSIFGIQRELPGCLDKETIGDNYAPRLVNAPLWTLPVETGAYVILAMLGVAGQLKLWATLTLSALFIAGALALPTHIFITAGTPLWLVSSYLAFFFIGSSYMFVEKRLPRMMMPAFVAQALYHLVQELMWICYPYILFCVCLEPVPYVSSIAHHIGDLSYGMYIYAWPIQRTLLLWGGIKSAPLNAFLTIVCVMPLAACSWFLVEKRALTLKPAVRKVAPGPRQAAANNGGGAHVQRGKANA